MVGPNGAGKTTTIECIEGLRQRTSGTVRVLGMDPERERSALLRRIGVQLQQSALQKRLKVREALQLFSDLYPAPAPWQAIAERLGLVASLNICGRPLSRSATKTLHRAFSHTGSEKIVFLVSFYSTIFSGA
ncbi:MAG TPA: ATP-binding cassette domain-containing protein [Firmicutes bacterium]|nr:ATP-binding cassette domain-containing protein [Candidatus Fermentithermobacillaceae bacterium]